MLGTLDQLLASHQRLYTHCLIELRDESGVHRVHLRGGLVQAVELASHTLRFGEVLSAGLPLPRALLDHASLAALSRRRLIGEVLVAAGLISLRVRDDSLDKQRTLRLRRLVALRHAEIFVGPAVPLPPGAAELLPIAPVTERAAALELLGIEPRATAVEIVKAYRRLVSALHPDHGGDEHSRELSAVVAAYRLLSSGTASGSVSGTA